MNSLRSNSIDLDVIPLVFTAHHTRSVKQCYGIRSVYKINFIEVALKQQLSNITVLRPSTVSLKCSEDGVEKSMLFEFEERVTWILADKRRFSVRSVRSLDF